MGVWQYSSVDVDSISETVDRHLEEIEVALDAGDVDTAIAQLRNVRRALLNPGKPATYGHDTTVDEVVLTGQEIKTLRQLPDGSLSQKDIARSMGVSRNTLKTHLKSLYLKLGVHCRAEAIHRARDVGLLPQPLTLVPVLPSDDRRIA